MTEKKIPELKFGLVGAGKWGQNYIKSIEKSKSFDLFAVSTKNYNIKNIVKPSCLVCQNWNELLNLDFLDGVIIATPPNTHFLIAKQFIKKGIPTLIEKPLTMSLKEAQDLLDLVNKDINQSIVFVDHIYLYDDYFMQLKKRAKNAGKIHKINSIGGSNGPVRKDVRALWDWAPHDLAMCLDIVGKFPISINAELIREEKLNIGSKELIKIELIFPEKIHANLLVGNFMKKKSRLFEVEFKNSRLVYEPLSDCTFKEYSKINKELYCQKNNLSNDQLPLDNLLRQFADAILNNKRNTASLKLGTDVVKIIENIEEKLDP